MPGISSVIELRDKFSNTATKYKDVVQKCSQSNIYLAKTVVSTMSKTQDVTGKLSLASMVTSKLAENQEYLQVAMKKVNGVFDQIVGKGDKFGHILDVSIKILGVASHFFSPLRYIVDFLERVRYGLDTGLNKFESIQGGLNYFVNNIDKIALKAEKFVKHFIRMKIAAAAIKKVSMAMIPVVAGIAAMWALVYKTQFGVVLRLKEINSETHGLIDTIKGKLLNVIYFYLLKLEAIKPKIKQKMTDMFYGALLKTEKIKKQLHSKAVDMFYGILLKLTPAVKKFEAIKKDVMKRVNDIFYGTLLKLTPYLNKLEPIKKEFMKKFNDIFYGSLLGAQRLKEKLAPKIRDVFTLISQQSQNVIQKVMPKVSNVFFDMLWHTRNLKNKIAPKVLDVFYGSLLQIQKLKSKIAPKVLDVFYGSLLKVESIKAKIVPKIGNVIQSAIVNAGLIKTSAMRRFADSFYGSLLSVDRLKVMLSSMKNNLLKGVGSIVGSIKIKLSYLNTILFVQKERIKDAFEVSKKYAGDYFRREFSWETMTTKASRWDKFKSSFVGIIKNTWKEAKTVTKKNVSDIGNIIKGAWAGYRLYSSAKGFIKGLQSWKNSYDKLSEATDYLIEKTQGLEKASKRIMTFGEQGAKAMGVYAREYAMMTGHAAGEIADVGQKMRRSGIGGKNMMEFMGIADMFAKLGDDISFEQAGSAIANSVFTGTTDELASLLGGGEYVERLLRRARIGRLLRRGETSEAMKRFMEIANGMGYTQEALDKVNNTLPTKLKRTKQMLEGYAGIVKGEFLKRVEPYVDQLMEFLKSKEFQGYFQQTLKKVLAVADGVGKVALFVVDSGRKFYQWWIEPSTGFLRILTMMIASMGMLVKLKQVWAVLKGGKGVFGILTRTSLLFGKSTFRIFKTLFGQFLIPVLGGFAKAWGSIFSVFCPKAVGRTESKIKKLGMSLVALRTSAIKGIKAIATAFLASPIVWIPALIFGIVKGCQKLVSSVNETKDAFTSTVEVVVGGLVYGGGKIWQILVKVNNYVNQFLAKLWDGFVGVYEGISGLVVRGINRLGIWFKKIKIWFMEMIVSFKTKLIELINTIVQSGIADYLLGEGTQKNLTEFAAKQVVANRYFVDEIIAAQNEIRSAEIENLEIEKGVRKGFLDSWKSENHKTFTMFKQMRVPTDDDLYNATQKALSFVLGDEFKGKVNSVLTWGKDLLGFGDVQFDGMTEAIEHLSNIENDTNQLRQMGQKERDLRWMKEMAEQRFVNEVNLRQLTPTIKVEVSGSESSADEIASTLERKLSHMASMGTFNAYGDIG